MIFLVGKGFSWSDLRDMEASRRRGYRDICLENDKAQREANRAAMNRGN